MKIIKTDGEIVSYNENNLVNSLKRSGASSEEINKILTNLKNKLFDNITSNQIYRLAYQELKLLKRSYAARYSLKKALAKLGPDGYNFEKWIRAVVKELGFKAEHSILLQGHAVQHEIDVLILDKDEQLIICECKFRNQFENSKIRVTTPMYFLSRVKDLKDKKFDSFGNKYKVNYGALITNVTFSSDSIKFAEYYGIRLVGWNYPEKYSIRYIADYYSLYPITCLTSLSKKELSNLIENNILLVKTLIEQPEKLKALQLTENKIHIILQEAKELCDFKVKN